MGTKCQLSWPYFHDFFKGWFLTNKVRNCGQNLLCVLLCTCHSIPWIKPVILLIGSFSLYFYILYIYTFFSTSLLLCGKFGSLTWVRHRSCKSSNIYPFLSAFAVFVCVQTMVWLPVFRVLNMCTDVEACDCTWGLHRHRNRVCNKGWLRRKPRLY